MFYIFCVFLYLNVMLSFFYFFKKFFNFLILMEFIMMIFYLFLFFYINNMFLSFSMLSLILYMMVIEGSFGMGILISIIFKNSNFSLMSNSIFF